MAPISRSFGTLYIDGRPAEPGVQLPQSAENPKIEIGNSDGRFIHWSSSAAFWFPDTILL